MEALSTKTCIPCQGGIPPLTTEHIAPLLAQLDNWTVIDDHHLTKKYKFPKFAVSLEFVNKVAAIAEQENHHPNILLTTREVTIDIWTHKINGLTESDFILAAKIDAAG